MSSKEITRLLRAWSDGDSDAREEVWPQVYGELKVLARSVLRYRRGGRKGPATTSLVNEAALRLLNLDVQWNDRQHFYALAARAMRFVMVDTARRSLAQKRAAEIGAVDSAEVAEDLIDPNTHRPEEVLIVHQALARLAKVSSRQVRLVELRYFAGMSIAETAEILGVSTPTAVRDWRAVKIWLHGQLQ
jgi:RNA polymerase sigma factor (TIGR02999 family)